jgi:hypothetical protein
LALALLAGSFAAVAGADVGATIIERCTNGQSLTGFSQQAYSKALQEMPAEVSEYSDCPNLIHKAELAAAGGRGSAVGAGAGSGLNSLAANVAPPTPAEQQALAHAKRSPTAPVQVGSAVVAPGVVHTNIASAVNSLPTPMLALLAFLFTCVLLIGGRAIRDRVRVVRANRSG